MTNAAVHDSRLLAALGEHLVKQGKNFEFRAAGSSMSPTILDGDIVRIGYISPHQVRVGNILFCRIGSRLVVHRVFRIEKTGSGLRFTLRGDSSSEPDIPVDGEHVLGKVLALKRGERLITVGQRHRLVTQHARVVMRAVKRQLKAAFKNSQC